ncbi:26107_t:CDS:2 [Gigaspora margarita]|uniref:26107_t:CDS:1 n=1 Tax=Gigaspora margarita TaxID=4874 RepID=A0ABN7VXT9_GIGMA|nr:26107_t:CDS:2 [Gigaspora margarita]
MSGTGPNPRDSDKGPHTAPQPAPTTSVLATTHTSISRSAWPPHQSSNPLSSISIPSLTNRDYGMNSIKQTSVACGLKQHRPIPTTVMQQYTAPLHIQSIQ